ncbi:MAG: ATP-binding cassette domain-containing protein [Treponema sp.]|jgi:energy-coupling factor transport system ATP-binding protein|nr:ATP-binding cassette domain-containing protein [Treponema sp.]
MISIRNLTFRYRGGGRDALSSVNLEVPGGDFIGIIGPSGAGKTTLTYAINGVVPHHFPGDFYGEVKINGLDSIDAGSEELARHVGSVFQDIDGQMTASVAEDEILFGLENFGVPHKDIPGRLEEALSGAGIENLRDRSLSSLSGGQKQKVAIAAITALRPSIIVLDEPTGELDPASSRRVFEFLRKLNTEQGITIIIVEQKIMLLCEFSKRLAVMDRGKLVLEGSVAEVLQEGERLEEAGVNIPRVSTLARRLRAGGIYSGPVVSNPGEGETMIRSILKKAPVDSTANEPALP